MNVELITQHKDKVYIPIVEDSITWTTVRQGAPGELTFKIVNDDIVVREGDRVSLKVDGKKTFYGFIFKMKRDKNQIINVTAYDQLRYLKNKDTYVYENKTASQFIRMVADDFKLNKGTIEGTKFKIKSRVESNKTLFDMIQAALDLTLQNTSTMYVLYDDFGKLTLKSLDKMKTTTVINRDVAEDYDYTSTIDENTYNKVKLTYDNKETSKREVYIAQSGQNINVWGVLQHYGTLQDGENGKAKAKALLKLYNHKTRKITIKNAIGDLSIRAGTLVPVHLFVGDMWIENYMLVEKCKHEFKESQHFMTLTLRGGSFVE